MDAVLKLSYSTKWVLFELLYLPNCFDQAAVEVAKYNVSCIFIFYYSVGFVCQVGPAFLIQQTLMILYSIKGGHVYIYKYTIFSIHWDLNVSIKW